MKISIVSSNEDLIGFLETATTGIQVINQYRTLTDERELNRFNNDFNPVDTFMFVDFQDISNEFKEFIDYLHKGKSYFFNVEEILLITWKDPKLSPTPDLERSLEAIESYMEKLNYKLRVVRLDHLKFQDIYKSITIKDSVTESAPKKLIKYKVTHNDQGITIPPKKSNVAIVPDKIKGYGTKNKMDDLQNSQALEATTIHVPDIVETYRSTKDFKDQLSHTLTDSTVVFISGVRYSGKTTLALKLAKELEEQNLTCVVMDLTSRSDLRLINKNVGCDLGMLKGLSIETSRGNPVIGMNVHSKVYTPTFIAQLVKSVIGSRAITFCEVDPDQLLALYKSFRGNKVTLIPVPNNLTMLRDTIDIANKLDFHVVPVANNLSAKAAEVNKGQLRERIQLARIVFDMDSLTELSTSLMR